MIAKQIDPPDYYAHYAPNGELTEAITFIATAENYICVAVKYDTASLRIGNVDPILELREEGIQQLEGFLAAIRHLRPNKEEER